MDEKVHDLAVSNAEFNERFRAIKERVEESARYQEKRMDSVASRATLSMFVACAGGFVGVLVSAVTTAGLNGF